MKDKLMIKDLLRKVALRELDNQLQEMNEDGLIKYFENANIIELNLFVHKDFLTLEQVRTLAASDNIDIQELKSIL